MAKKAGRKGARVGGRLGSAWAVVAGFLAVVVLSLGTDQLLHVLKVYPAWGLPLWDTNLLLLATAYRAVFAGVGGSVTARLAPGRPLRHVWILAGVGLLAGAAGAAGTMSATVQLSPNWYPIAVAVTGPLATLYGGGVRFKP